MLWRRPYCEEVSVRSSSGKREGSEELRRSSDNQKEPHCCVYCNNNDNINLKCCGRCGAVSYCSNRYQKNHWKDHQQICDAIFSLSSQQKKEMGRKGQYQAHLIPKEKKKLVSLIGKQTIVKVFMSNMCNDKYVNILWDTGANISIIGKECLYSLFPNISIRNLQDILSESDKLHIRWGNQQEIPYEGYIELEVSFSNSMDKKVLVSFLVTSQEVQIPIQFPNPKSQYQNVIIPMSYHTPFNIVQKMHQLMLLNH